MHSPTTPETMRKRVLAWIALAAILCFATARRGDACAMAQSTHGPPNELRKGEPARGGVGDVPPPGEVTVP
jgi:predicted pyridoxine 5'-phosphate oxidase superfamily flavin-nucleotide-binding protein